MSAAPPSGSPAAFRTIAMDPPWPEKGGGGRGAQSHYDVVPLPRMPEVILRCPLWRPANDSHLYVWATNTHLIEAGNIMEQALGFRYITCLTWAKAHVSIGQYFRGKTEHLLFGVRGSGLELRREHTERRDLTTLIEPPWRLIGHSAKPPEAYRLIEEASPGPYLEMFAREPRAGWTTWGNELPEAA